MLHPRTKVTPALAIAVLATTASAQPLIDHSSRISPAEVLGGNDFGSTFDISDGVIAANLPRSSAPPIPIGNQGEVLLIDAVSGLTLRRLIPTSPSLIRGIPRVAIDGSTVAAIQGIGTDPGSLFVFDAVTGAQRFEIEPDAGDSFTQFYGSAIEVGDGVIAVGNPGYETISNDPFDLREKIELYDAQTGAPLGELESNIPDVHEGFGNEICIHNGKIAVSALQQVIDFGGSAERVVVFDLTTQQELFVIEPPAGVLDDAWFGDSVAMNDDYIVVSATLDDANGQDSGSVFVFEAGDGTYLHTLDIGATPNLTNPSDLSITVDINSEGLIVVSMAGGTTFGASIHEASTGVRTGTLVQGTVPGSSGPSDEFGSDAIIDGETIFVSDPRMPFKGSRRPSIFRFDPPVLIAQQPQDLVVDTAGQDFFMQVVASNADSYQWFFDGQPISDGPSYLGSDTSVLVITSGPEVAGRYTVEVTSLGFGSVISDPAYYVYRGGSAPACAADLFPEGGDGVLNFLDLGEYLNQFGQGCP